MKFFSRVYALIAMVGFMGWFFHGLKAFGSDELSRARHYLQSIKAPEPHRIGTPAVKSQKLAPAPYAYQVPGNHRLPLEAKPQDAPSYAATYVSCTNATGLSAPFGSKAYEQCVSGNDQWNHTSPSSFIASQRSQVMLIRLK